MRLLLLVTLLFAATSSVLAQPTDPAPSASRSIEILIAGPESGRTKMQEILRSLIGTDTDLRWSLRDSLPGDEGLPSARGDGSARI